MSLTLQRGRALYSEVQMSISRVTTLRVIFLLLYKRNQEGKEREKREQ